MMELHHDGTLPWLEVRYEVEFVADTVFGAADWLDCGHVVGQSLVGVNVLNEFENLV